MGNRQYIYQRYTVYLLLRHSMFGDDKRNVYAESLLLLLVTPLLFTIDACSFFGYRLIILYTWNLTYINTSYPH